LEVWSRALQSPLDDLESTLPLSLDDSGLLQGMRCATHTLQLAVSDALKGSGCGQIVEDCRALVKKLCVQSVMSLIRKLGLKKPVIDCPTWLAVHAAYDLQVT
ncbi:MAG: hypothetical protein PV344_02445, partial [Anaplasma sp.]|nr:hypothetical protein [Anaplasma sp.]